MWVTFSRMVFSSVYHLLYLHCFTCIIYGMAHAAIANDYLSLSYLQPSVMSEAERKFVCLDHTVISGIVSKQSKPTGKCPHVLGKSTLQEASIQFPSHSLNLSRLLSLSQSSPQSIPRMATPSFAFLLPRNTAVFIPLFFFDTKIREVSSYYLALRPL